MTFPQPRSAGCTGAKHPAWRALLSMAWMLLALGLAHPAATGQTQGSTSSGSPSVSNPYSVVAPGVNGQNGVNQAPANLQIPGVQGMNVGAGMNLPTMLYPDPKQYVLTAGDLINIRLFGSNDYATVERISKDGTVELPLIGSMNLVGITVREAEEAIAGRLRSAGMYKNPQIMISIAESASPLTITLTGEMHGVFPMQGQRALLDVLAAFGGLPTTAGRTVTIIRPGVEAPILVDLGTTAQDLVRANVPLYPHDTIFIERAGVVYVVGAFKTTGAFPLQPGRETLMQMAAVSGGPQFAAKYSDLRIIRTVGLQRTEVKVDIKKVLYGKAPDPILQSGDILFLPPNPYKAVVANGNFGILLSVVYFFVFLAQSQL